MPTKTATQITTRIEPVKAPKVLGIVKLATGRRVTIGMLTLAVIVFGFVSLSRLKLNLLPELSYPSLTVRTDLPGAAPEEVENLVSKPIEEAVSVIKNVRQVRSISRPGESDVTLERSEEHTSELQSHVNLVCRLLLEKKKE